MKDASDAILRAEQAAYLEGIEPARDALLVEMEDFARGRGEPISDPEVASFLAVAASAQQFQQVTNLPGAAKWSEGVECADVDHDGDLDIFFADGNGFSSNQGVQQHGLMINQLELGAWTFSEQSVARLGA